MLFSERSPRPTRPPPQASPLLSSEDGLIFETAPSDPGEPIDGELLAEATLDYEREQSKFLDSTQAANQRIDSRQEFRQLNDTEARNTLGEIFGQQLGLLSADPSDLLLGAGSLISFRGERTALIDPDGPAESALVTSTLPLKTGAGEPVDASLRTQGGSFVAKEPLTGIAIPADPSDLIELPDGIGVSLGASPNAADGAPMSFDDDARREVVTYANTAPDTDSGVISKLTGIEAFAQLRSPASPEETTYELTLPTGSELFESGEGGAFVLGKDGELQMSILAPHSVDAQGADVPTTMRVEGDALILSHPHRTAGFAYPILVDPEFVVESRNWWAGGIGAGTPGWASNSSGSSNYYISNDCPSALSSIDPCGGANAGQGLFAGAKPNTSYPAGSKAWWTWTAPGGSDTYISQVHLNSWKYRKGATSSTSPYAFYTLTPGGGAMNVYSTDGGGSDQLSGTSDTRYFNAGLYSNVASSVGSGANNWRYARLAAFTAELKDQNSPTLNPLNTSAVPTGWMAANQGFAVTASASDQGLGIRGFKSYSPWPSDQTGSDAGSFGCSGSYASPCQTTVGQTSLFFNSNQLPNGVTSLALTAVDALDKESDPRILTVKVDKSAPVVTVSGGATEDATDPGRDLRVEAIDANSSALRSGIQTIQVKIEGTEVYSETLPCDLAQDSCPQEVTRDIELPYESLLADSQEIEVVVKDQVGNLGKESDGSTPDWQEPVEPGDVIDVNDTTGPANFTDAYGDDEDATGIPPDEPASASGSGGGAWASGPRCNLVVPVPFTPKKFPVRKNGELKSIKLIGRDRCADIIDISSWTPNVPITIKGLGGNDILIGTANRQIIEGGRGNDLLIGGRNNDELNGGRGNDSIYGGIDDDELEGWKGEDLLVGGPGADVVKGGPQADLVRGGQGTDNLAGGGGTDTVSFADATTPGFDHKLGGTVIDNHLPSGFPQVNDELRGVFVQLARSVLLGKLPFAYNGEPRLGGGIDFLCITKKSGNRRVCKNGDRFERVIGSPFADYITGSGRDEVIMGGAGTDILMGRAGEDRIFGGLDDDYIAGSSSSILDGGRSGSIETNRCIRNGNPWSNQGASCSSSVDPLQWRLPGSHTNQVAVGIVEQNGYPYSGGGGQWNSNRSRRDVFVTGSDVRDVLSIQYQPRPHRRVVVKLLAGSESTFASTSYAGNSGCDPVGSGSVTKVVCEDIDERSTNYNPPQGRDAYFSLGAVVAAGRGGDDVITASGFPRQFNVTLLGGLGRDELTGGTSDDLLIDGDNQDSSVREVLKGNSGDDALINNRGGDILRGDENNDLLLSTSLCDGDEIGGGGGVNSAQWAQLPVPPPPYWPQGANSSQKGQPAPPGVFSDLQAGEVGYYDKANKPNAPACPGGGLLSTMFNIRDMEGSGNSDYFRGDGQDNRLLPRGGDDVVLGYMGADTIQANDGERDQQIGCGADNASDKVTRDTAGALGGTVESLLSGECDSNDERLFRSPLYSGRAKRYYTETGDVPTVTAATNPAANDLDDVADSVDPLSLVDTGLESFNYVARSDGSDIPVPETYYELGAPNAPQAEDLDPDVAQPDGEIPSGPISGEDASLESFFEDQPDATYLDSASDPGQGQLEPPVFDEGSMTEPDPAGAVTLEGSGDRILLEDDPDPGEATETGYSVSMLVNFQSGLPATREYLFTRDAPADVEVFRDADGRIVFETRRNGALASVTGETIDDIGSWHHVVGVIDSNELSVFVDGNSTTLGLDRDAAPLPDATAETVVGAIGVEGSPALSLDALVDDVAVYSEALDDGDVRSIMLGEDVEVPDVEVLGDEAVSVDADTDSDGLTDEFDNCPAVQNANQDDGDGDGIGDACDPLTDRDGDSVADQTDNCPDIPNTAQADSDSDGIGDACEELMAPDE